MFDNTESTTAKICSLSRAFHAKDNNKIFDDYLAYNFIGENQLSKLQNIILTCLANDKCFKKDIDNCISKWLYNYFSPITLPRSAFAEKRLKDFAKKYQSCQYIILGAGLDTFSFRNKNKNIKIFEIDHPNTQIFKKNRLNELSWKIPENVSFISVDFEKENLEKLMKNNDFNTELPTFYTILGVTYYINFETLQNLVETISQLTKNNIEIILDFPDDTTFKDKSNIRAKTLSAITKMMGEQMQQGFSLSEIQNILKQNKFEISKYMNPDNIQEKFFKDRTDGQKAYKNVHFLAATYKKV